MKALRVALFWLFMLAINNTLIATEIFNEYQMQPEVFHPSTPGYGTVDAQGDLNLQIPVMTVPGRGLDFPIVFNYHSSIKVNQSSNWVGLGWSFDPGSITRDVKGSIMTATDQPAAGVDFPGSVDTDTLAHDLYYLHMNGSTTTFIQKFQESSATDYLNPKGDFYPGNWRPIKIVPIDTSTVTVDGKSTTQPDYTGFVVYAEDGTRYVYAKPTLAQYRNIGPSPNSTTIPRDGINYVSTWRLVAILGTSYAGVNLVPDDTTSGSWIKLTYRYDSSNEFKTCESDADNPSNVLTQLSYLHKITTPTHEATFNTVARTDINANVNDDGTNIKYHKRISYIELKSRFSGNQVEKVVLNPGYIDNNDKMLLRDITLFGKDNNNPQQYSFEYWLENENASAQFGLGHYDDFGYFNTANAQLFNNDTSSAKAWSLKEITYPTGGSEYIKYKNDVISQSSISYYRWVLGDVGGPDTDSYTFSGGKSMQGGVRVDSVIRDDAMGNTYTFVYGYGPGYATSVPPYKFSRCDYVLNMGGSRGHASVYYTSVTETDQDGNSKTTSYSRGSTYADDLSNTLVYSSTSQVYYSILQSNCDMLYGIPISINYSGGGESWTKNNTQTFIPSRLSKNSWFTTCPVYYYMGITTLDSVTVYDKGVQYITTYDYLDRAFLARKTKFGTDGAQDMHKVTTYRYAHEFEEYADMKDKNMLSQRVKEDVFTHTPSAVTYGQKTVFAEVLGAGNDSDTQSFTVPFPQIVSYSCLLLDTPKAYATFVVTEGGNEIIRISGDSGSDSTTIDEDFWAVPGLTYSIQAIASSGQQGTRAFCFCTLNYQTNNGDSCFVSNVTTWKPHEINEIHDYSWLPHRYYSWKQDYHPQYTSFDAYGPTETPSNSQWVLTRENTNYNRNCLIRSQQDALGTVTSFYYGNNTSNMSNSTCAYPSTSCFVNSYLTGVTKDGHFVKYDYDVDTGKLASITDDNGNVTSYEYDNLNRLEYVKNNSKTINEYEYNITQSCSPVGPNSVTSKSYFDNTHYATSITYYDGLARAVQTQVDEGSDLIVTENVYDQHDRAIATTKPARITSPSFGFRPNFIYGSWSPGSAMSSSSEVCNYYNGSNWVPDANNYPFTRTIYKYAPADRVKEIIPPGSAFQSHKIQYAYSANASAELGYTSANTLLKTRTTDENGHYTDVYTDQLGNQVGQKVYLSGETLTTRTITDVLGNVIQIVPPNANGSTASPYCSEFYYNTLGNLFKKITPDMRDSDGDPGVIQYKYDDKGNLRFFQDTNLADWDDIVFYIYDNLNRPIITGESTNEATRPYWFNLDGNIDYRSDGFYNFENIGTNGVQYYLVNCYDQEPTYGTGVWSDAADPGVLDSLNSRLAATAYYDEATDAWGYTFYSYTSDGRVKKVIQDLPGNYLGVKTTEYTYDRQGNVVQMDYQAGQEDAFHTWYEYDIAGRLQNIYTDTTTNSNYPIAEYTYWPTGQVKRKQLRNPADSSHVQGVDYVYHIRDWVKQINDQDIGDAGDDPGNDSDDRFGEVIGYNDLTNIGTSFGIGNNYNGNISDVMTNTYGFSPHLTGYTFSYDYANRLLMADGGYYSGSWQQHSGNGFDLRGVDYDKNGNFETLQRYSEAGVLEHNFQYKYYANTNRLQNLNDSAENQYTYDYNGNMTSDDNKGITLIQYDYRNLPFRIQTGTGGNLFHGYDAQGNRVMKRVSSPY